MNEKALAQYRELLQRVEDKFGEIRAKHPTQFQCALGCHSCCKPGLTVNRLEQESLRLFLKSNPEAKRSSFGKSRCDFLSAEGNCQVYEARPLVCRSHGAPLQFRPLEKVKDENLRHRDVCPLNFTSLDIGKLAPEDVLNLDTINTLLSLLNKMAFPGSEERIPLTLEAVLSSEA